MIQEVNDAFKKSHQQIICLLIAPANEEGLQLMFNKFLASFNERIDEQLAPRDECCVIAVIKDESLTDKPYYFFKPLDNIFADSYEDEG